MVVMIDLENLAAYEKYRKKLAADADAAAKEIVEFAIKSGCILVEAIFIFMECEDESERMKR
jgi:hypothetical protein